MFATAETTDVSPVVYPAAVVHLSAEQGIPGVWLNTATLALAEAGAGVEQLRAFRAQALSGGIPTLLATIAAWVVIA